MPPRRVVRRNPRNDEGEELPPAMRNAIANQVAAVLENALPTLLHDFLEAERERIRKGEQERPRAGAPERRCDYKSFKACGL